MFTVPGQYDYQCPVATTNNSNLKVVSVQHKVAVCANSNCEKSLSANVGDFVYWSFVDDSCQAYDLVSGDCSGELLQHYVYYKMAGKYNTII